MLDRSSGKIFFYTAPMDMRRSIDGLSAVVSERLSLEPYDGRLYVFCNRARDKLKILYWDRNGFCLWYKRLEKERFQVCLTGETVMIDSQQLRWILDGLDYQQVKGHQARIYKGYS